MQPRMVVLFLGIMLFLGVCQYLFFIPPSIANTAVKSENEGHWSPSTSDFDWCERNYVFSRYIAEPFNSGTSLIYIVVALVQMHAANAHIPRSVATADLKVLGLFLICIGIGSTLFHGSLTYDMQLFDEIPMHWFTSMTSVMMFTRNDTRNHSKRKGSVREEKSGKFMLYTVAALMAVVIDAIILQTPKHSAFHQGTKVVMAISFVTGFVYSFYVTAKLTNEVLAEDPADSDYQKINEWFNKGFFAFAVALVGWICDNSYCESLRNLTVWGARVPYLQYHAVLWHCGTCIGLYYVLMVMLAHRVIFEYGMRPKCITIFGGILPFVSVTEKNKTH